MVTPQGRRLSGAESASILRYVSAACGPALRLRSSSTAATPRQEELGLHDGCILAVSGSEAAEAHHPGSSISRRSGCGCSVNARICAPGPCPAIARASPSVSTTRRWWKSSYLASAKNAIHVHQGEERSNAPLTGESSPSNASWRGCRAGRPPRSPGRDQLPSGEMTTEGPSLNRARRQRQRETSHVPWRRKPLSTRHHAPIMKSGRGHEGQASALPHPTPLQGDVEYRCAVMASSIST